MSDEVAPEGEVMSDDEHAAIIAAELKAVARSVPPEVYEERLRRAGVWLDTTDVDEVRAQEDELFLAFAKALIAKLREEHGEENYQRAKREATAQRRQQSG